MIHDRAVSFREDAPTTAAQAATVILDGVKAGRWRILIGDDAHRLDELVREFPEEAYEESFIEKIVSAGALERLVGNNTQVPT